MALIDLGGRTALVTGAGLVGREIASTLAAHGAGTVVVTDLSRQQADEAADAVRANGADALPVVADLTDRASVAALAEATRALTRPVQVVVNNAGMPPGSFEDLSWAKKFADSTPEDWEPLIRLNLYGVLYVTHAFIAGMLESGWGRVVTIISDAGRTGDPYMAAYAAAKAGAAGFMRSLATEVGRQGVTANCVALGTLWRDPEPPTPEQLAKQFRRYPLGGPGYPQDVAALVAFLASDAARWVTGQVYPLNGGYSYAL
ncbi:MAG TPA: SDR family NAD(P)-dependent oxidoreductase [Acidimicrobiales bacterium]|nr:SDR family NAD(P)-dependent oxidoreductase [Acidimicrobiales bacterium]